MAEFALEVGRYYERKRGKPIQIIDTYEAAGVRWYRVLTSDGQKYDQNEHALLPQLDQRKPGDG